MIRLVFLILAIGFTSPLLAQTPVLFPGTFYPAELINGNYYGDDDCDFNCGEKPLKTYHLTITNYHLKLIIQTYAARIIGEGIYSNQLIPNETVFEADCQPLAAVMPKDLLSDLIGMECSDNASKTIVEWHMKSKELKDKYPITLTVKSPHFFADVRMQKTNF